MGSRVDEFKRMISAMDEAEREAAASGPCIPARKPYDNSDLANARREVRELRKHLKELTTSVVVHLARLDDVMKGPTTVERGKAIARLAGELELANDRVRYFGLGVPLKKLSEDGRAIVRVVDAANAQPKG